MTLLGARARQRIVNGIGPRHPRPSLSSLPAPASSRAQKNQPSSRVVTPKMRSRSSSGAGPLYMRTVLNIGVMPYRAASARLNAGGRHEQDLRDHAEAARAHDRGLAYFGFVADLA